MVLVVANRRRQRLGREERRLDGVHPADEALDDGADPSLPVFAEQVAGEAELLRRLFLAVDRADEGATFSGEYGLRVLGVAKLPAAVGVASGLDDAT